MAASVLSTGISEMAPTAVVLPTPKPPAMMILTGIGTTGAGSGDAVESTDHPLDDLGLPPGMRHRPGHAEVARGHEVTDQDARDTKLKAQARRDLDDRVRRSAQREDLARLELQP